jgi:hypothetical protein
VVKFFNLNADQSAVLRRDILFSESRRPLTGLGGERIFDQAAGMSPVSLFHAPLPVERYSHFRLT